MPDELDELERRFHQDAEASPPGEAEGAEREALRSSLLARRLAKRRGYAVAASEPKTRRLLSSYGLAGVALLAAWSLWGALPGLAWWMSRGPPTDLGRMGAYRLDGAHDGDYARVEGIASPKRGTYSRYFGMHELFPLIASRILVDRAQAPDESLRGFGFRYAGEGRLHKAEPGGKWAAVREQFAAAGELAREGDVWVLEDGVVPGKGLAPPAEAAAWALLGLGCVVLLVRRAVERRARAEQTTSTS